MEIRFASLKDIPEIIKVARKTWPVSYKHIISDQQINYMLDLFYSPVSLLNQIEILEHKFLLIEDDDHNVKAFAAYSYMPAVRGVRLHKLYVLPENQHLGFGKILVSTIIDLVKRENFTFLELNVNKNNTALHFYIKNGFALVREEDIDIGSGFFMNDYILKKEI